jgi:hypothetical protein
MSPETPMAAGPMLARDLADTPEGSPATATGTPLAPASWRSSAETPSWSSPLSPQPYGLGDRDIERVLLATRHAGRTLFPLTEWPAFVYVIRIVDDTILETRQFSADQVRLILWGVLFKERPRSGS